MYYIVGRIVTEAESKGTISEVSNESYVRVLNTDDGSCTDYELSSLIKYMKDGVIELENAVILNDEFKMINGDLENYGIIISHADTDADFLSCVPVVLAVLKSGIKVIGYLCASSDGGMFEYTGEELLQTVNDLGCANAKVTEKDGNVLVVTPQKPLPVLAADDIVSAEEAEEDVSSAVVENPLPEESNWVIEYIDVDGKTETITFPISDTGKKFESIGISGVEIVIQGDSLQGVRIKEPVQNSNILSITFANNLKFIGESFCEGWSKLKRVVLPNTIEVLEQGAFADCTSLEIVEQYENVEVIGSMCFANCKSLNAMFVFEKVRELRTGAFYNSGVQTVKFMNKTLKVGCFAFAKSTIMGCVFPVDTLKALASNAKKYKKLMETGIEPDAEELSVGIFKDCINLKKTNIAIGDYASFGDYLIKGCTALYALMDA